MNPYLWVVFNIFMIVLAAILRQGHVERKEYFMVLLCSFIGIMSCLDLMLNILKIMGKISR